MRAAPPKLATIIGGSGFVGTQLVQQLARKGFRIRVGVRRPDLAGHLRPLGTVGQIQPIQVNIRNFDSIARAVSGADVVINLVGILHESGRQRFRAVHTVGAANAAKAAADAGVKTFVHMSALGANTQSKSAYLVSKALGEAEVLGAFPEAVIIRPSMIFGPGDRFFNLVGMLARLFPVLPVIHGQTRFQPVHVGDVAKALAFAASGVVKGGTPYELGGPDVETMTELMGRVLSESKRHNLLVNVPAGLARFEARFIQILPNPWLTVDQVNQLGEDSVVSDEAVAQKRTLQTLGVTPKTMDAVLPTYMWRFRKNGQFEPVKS
jgi:uncharacterized protein YbjT (DUF2867 family)